MEAVPEALRQLLRVENTTRLGESAIYSVCPLVSCPRYSKFPSIQMTRHHMIGGYLLRLWLNLGALPHGKGATRVEVATSWWIDR
jgi:hypothetical protein